MAFHSTQLHRQQKTFGLAARESEFSRTLRSLYGAQTVAQAFSDFVDPSDADFRTHWETLKRLLGDRSTAKIGDLTSEELWLAGLTMARCTRSTTKTFRSPTQVPARA